MKHLKLIFAAIMVAFALTPVVHTVSVSALSDSKIQECYDKWNGKAVDRNDSGTYHLAGAYASSDCPDGKGGNCKVIAINDSKGKISCTKASAASQAEGVADPALSQGGCSTANCGFIDQYINPTIKLLSALVGIVAVIFIILGAIQVSTSAGDPQKAAAGKNHIRNALLGMVGYVLLFVLLSWLIPGGII